LHWFVQREVVIGRVLFLTTCTKASTEFRQQNKSATRAP